LNAYFHGEWKPEYEKLLAVSNMTGEIDYPRFAWNSALMYDIILNEPVLYEFDQLTMPVLLIIGQKDRTAVGKDKASSEQQEKMGLYSELGKQAAKKIKQAKLVELEGIGHNPHMESYDQFLKPLIEFLQ
jgi:pimeloyl-ACP methyl ester carboxylesterase